MCLCSSELLGHCPWPVPSAQLCPHQDEVCNADAGSDYQAKCQVQPVVNSMIVKPVFCDLQPKPGFTVILRGTRNVPL